MLGERRVDREREVGGRAHIEADVRLGQLHHQVGVLDGTDAVLDAVGTEGGDGPGDALGTFELAGVRGAEQPAGEGDVERLGEGLGRAAGLVVVEAEAHHPLCGVAHRQAGLVDGVGGVPRAVGGDQQARPDAVTSAAWESSSSMISMVDSSLPSRSRWLGT